MPQKILVVDDEKLVRWSIRQKLEAAGYDVMEAESAQEALTLFRLEAPDLVTLDIRLPDETGIKVLLEMKKIAEAVAVIMITAHGAIEDAVRALQLGAYDYLEKPINFGRLLHSIQNALETKQLRSEIGRERDQRRRANSIERIIGESSPMRRVKALVKKVACSEANTILIQGESGTGKDLVAKALHFESPRANRPFMVLNCAAIPEQLLENELFGHEKGAFTDASSLKKGLLELANRGSVFFDEISEIPLNLQSKLLRALEDRAFRRVGGVRDIEVDVRIICASNRDLSKLTGEGLFREDLFYRLSVILIELPTLSERTEDLELLSDHFIDHYNKTFKKAIKGLSEQARGLLKSYRWPGNVRELRNAIERASLLQDGEYVDLDIIPITSSAPTGDGNSYLRIPSGGISLRGVEKSLIEQALSRCSGNQSQASRLLSISRDTLRYKIKKYGIGSG